MVTEKISTKLSKAELCNQSYVSTEISEHRIGSVSSYWCRDQLKSPMAAETTEDKKGIIEVPCSNDEKVLENYMMLFNEHDRLRSICTLVKQSPSGQSSCSEAATFVRFEELLRSPPPLHSRIRSVGVLVFEELNFWLRSMFAPRSSEHRLLLHFNTKSRFPDPMIDNNIIVMVLAQHSQLLCSPQSENFYCVEVWNRLEDQKQIDMCYHLYDTIKALHS